MFPSPMNPIAPSDPLLRQRIGVAATVAARLIARPNPSMVLLLASEVRNARFTSFRSLQVREPKELSPT